MNPTKQEVMSVPVFFLFLFLNSGIDFMIVFSQHLHKTCDQLIPSVFRRVRATYVHWVPPKQTRMLSRR